MVKKVLLSLALGLMTLALTWPAQAQEKVVNIYSARHYESDKELFEQFQKDTGIPVNVVSAAAPELIERIKREGEATEADLFITVDGGILYSAKEAGVLAPIDSALVKENVPANLRDKDNLWVGLTTRARIIVYSKERVKPGDVANYEDLADPKWKGKTLARPSSSLYDEPGGKTYDFNRRMKAGSINLLFPLTNQFVSAILNK
ncbi:MAG: extracellular solute-binding protein [Deltaproteobacteria bacterium]|jgi:iron(III) transport system substrate-binding protein|nr:extracellular solute-binding protein [Deltaproteobacteria bacterium]